MSRIGRKPIQIPAGVEIKLNEREIIVKGPKGEITASLISGMQVTKEGESLFVSPANREGGEHSRKILALWGLARQLISNMVDGVTKGFAKKLEIEGVGYRAVLEGQDLVLSVGYSKPVRLHLPKGIAVTIDKNVITVLGNEKAQVGQFAAAIRRTRPVEPYKGKGIRYQGEFVRRKLGKRAVGAAGTKA